MTRSVCHVATPDDAGKRIDTVLAERGLYKSRSAAAKAIADHRVLVGGHPAAKKDIVDAGDPIVCELEDAGIATALRGEPIPLDVRFEDDDILVLSKQKGLICHPADDHREGTLVNALIHRYGAEGLCDVQGEADRLGIVHRLDGDTSGLMLAAKTDDAGRSLMEAIGLREVDRRYIALIHGVMQPDSGMIDAPIGRNPADRKTMAVSDASSARDAITTFRVLERFGESRSDNGYTLIECKLYTGRTHQIRVHMQYTRHPIVGDRTYAKHAPKDASSQLGLDRQFLHSYALGFIHPVSGQQMHFTDHLPDDLAGALDRIAERSLGRTELGEEVLPHLISSHLIR